MMINEDYFIKYLKNELTEEETRLRKILSELVIGQLIMCVCR